MMTDASWMIAAATACAAACAGAGAHGQPPASTPVFPPVCPAGTERTVTSDSDVGWGEVEQTDSCARSDGTLDGPAVQLVSAGMQPSTRLVGQFASGRRVGTWRQFDGKTGALLGSFTLDGAGTGTEVIHDALGHTKRGAVIAGRRDGAWTLQDADGKVVATELWSKGVFVRQNGRAPWDPPMVSPADACPAEPAPNPADRDGCPEPAPRAK
jgi:hypothetical protein